MRLPYKYPYLSIFIVGYYLLEHEGYYYKLKKHFGYSDPDNISYVIKFDQNNLDLMTKAPGRKVVVYAHESLKENEMKLYSKIAKRYKETLRSPIIFGEMLCNDEIEVCRSSSRPFLMLFHEGKIERITEGVVDKKKIKHIIKEK